MKTSNKYFLYGLPIHSDLDLPELMELKSGTPRCELDPAQIVRGAVPKHLASGIQANPEFEYVSDECLVRVADIAEFQVSKGSRIVVQAEPGAKENDVRAFLFGTIMGALLHQRGLLPLHVSALASPKGIVAFTGHSGAGKSTLAGMVHKLTNWPMLCDDVAVIDPDDETFRLHVGMVRLKLWSDAIERLDLDHAKRFQDTTRDDKFHVFNDDMFTDEPGPMTSLFMIEAADRFSVDPVQGGEVFGAITKTIYRPEFIDLFNDRNKIVSRCADIANQTNVYRYSRPWDPNTIVRSTEQLIEFIETDAQT